MSVAHQKPDPIFMVNRSNVVVVKKSPKRKIPLKTYQVTNDEQRFKLINKVMGTQQLTIRKVN